MLKDDYRFGAGDIPPDWIELDKVPRRAWEQTLAPLHPQQRFFVANRIEDEELRELAHEMVQELEDRELSELQARDAAHHRARRTAAPLPSPDAALPASVQVNLRLRRDDYDRLTEAATAVGLRPTTLARALVLNGTAKVLQERGAG